MKVSVLIPTYNSNQYLSECLDSVGSQDFNSMEILISDDVSSDDTIGTIRAYAARDSRIRWWQNPKNLGFVGNHNICLEQASAEYIKFIHPDDKLLSTSAIRKMAAALDENPSAVVAGCQQHVTGKKSRPTVFSRKSGRYDGRRMIVASLEQNTNLIGQLTLAMFRRSAAQGGFDNRFIGHMDFAFWCRLLEHGDFAYLAESLAAWRVHETQQTARHEQTGSSNHEHLLCLETFYATPWLRKAATDRMLFTQIYYLKKNYGPRAENLTSAMLAQLLRRRYAWQWLLHKVSRPFQKLARKLPGAAGRSLTFEKLAISIDSCRGKK
ncbi:MAG TPA: glycosyltransferase family 2 protein [Candidatus Sulfopaludibacter sp.]|nr:glycosyltransferase family 2 protein [Candidatus Sulfopaludibacter sp.]